MSISSQHFFKDNEIKSSFNINVGSWTSKKFILALLIAQKIKNSALYLLFSTEIEKAFKHTFSRNLSKFVSKGCLTLSLTVFSSNSSKRATRKTTLFHFPTHLALLICTLHVMWASRAFIDLIDRFLGLDPVGVTSHLFNVEAVRSGTL